MSPSFGKNYPALVRPGNRFVASHQRERVYFFAAAGLAAFLFFTVIFVLNFKDRAVAKENIAPTLTTASSAPGVVSLLAPDRQIRAGTKLSEISLKEVFWPRNQVPNEAIRDRAELRDFYAVVDIPEGMPIQRSHLTREFQNVGLPLTPGNRAVSIEIDQTSGIEGWALPGSRVDIVLTFMSAGELTTKVIVQNARVLSLGGQRAEDMQPRVRGMLRDIKKTITLDVSQQDALTMTTAKEMGRLTLLMRSPDDNKPVQIDELPKNNISNESVKKGSDRSCTRGSMKIDGKEYVIDCDSNLQRVDEFEP